MTRSRRLEGVAYWAKQAMGRRKAYEASHHIEGDSIDERADRTAELWKQVKSADALLNAELECLERESGPVDLSLSVDR